MVLKDEKYWMLINTVILFTALYEQHPLPSVKTPVYLISPERRFIKYSESPSNTVIQYGHLQKWISSPL